MEERMKRLAFVTLGLMIATNSAYAQNFSSEDLIRRTIERRAVEAIIWGMPAVNAELMFGAMNDAGADFNQVVYWSRPVPAVGVCVGMVCVRRACPPGGSGQSNGSDWCPLCALVL